MGSWVFLLVFFKPKSHNTFSSWSWTGGKTSKTSTQLNNTVVPHMHERSALTAGGGVLQTPLNCFKLLWRRSEKNLHIEVAGLTQSGQEPDTLLDLQHFNSLWLIIRGKVSNMFRHNYLLLLQDLTPAWCSIFGPFLWSSKYSTRTLSGRRDLSVLAQPTASRGVRVWRAPVFETMQYELESAKSCSIKKNPSRQLNEKQEYVCSIYTRHLPKPSVD